MITTATIDGYVTRSIQSSTLGMALALSLGVAIFLYDAPLQASEKTSIQWKNWDTKSFESAQQSQRPIFLYVYSTWSLRCRQMEAYTFSNKKLAHLINHHFIPIRVDRDRRPDIDRRYQEAVQAMAGTSGWPLVAVLTPTGDILYGGTFQTATTDVLNKQPGLGAILMQAASSWKHDRQQMNTKARAFNDKLNQKEVLPNAIKITDALPKDAIDAALIQMQQRMDPEFGGFQGRSEGPRFIAPQALILALNVYSRTRNLKDLVPVSVTMQAMLKGGIHDRLGGGFHRMALDKRWRTPRFEKLLSANAELLHAFLLAYQTQNKPEYAQAARGIIRWARTHLYLKNRKGFAASQASGLTAQDDGNYYTWTSKEMEATTSSRDEARFCATLYEIGDWGDLPESAPHRNVLFEAMGAFHALGNRPGNIQALHTEASDRRGQLIKKLQDARLTREAPPIDRTLLIDANARMVSALLLAADTFHDSSLRVLALNILDAILSNAVQPEHPHKGVAHFITMDHKAIHLGLATDEVALGMACLDAYVATLQKKYLDATRERLQHLNQFFRDPEKKMYRDRILKNAPLAPTKTAWRPPDLGRLQHTLHPFQDSPGPSVNGLATALLLKFAVLTGEETFAHKAEETLKAFGPLLKPLGRLGASLLLSLDAHQHGWVTVVVEGAQDAPATHELLKLAASVYAPHKILLRIEPGQTELLKPMGFHLIHGAETPAQPVVWIRIGKNWSGPFSDQRKVRLMLEVAGR